jgi:hypothetical protein
VFKEVTKVKQRQAGGKLKPETDIVKPTRWFDVPKAFPPIRK